MIVRRRVQHTVVVPVENGPSPASNGKIIDQHDRSSYLAGADFLNESNLDAVSIQHEFGIFGGECGEYILDLCRNLESPFITTFHSVIMKPNQKTLEVVREISHMSMNVVVTLESAKKLLKEDYGVAREKIRVIPHGATIPEQRKRSYARQRLHLRNRTVLMTTGLINPGKGKEHAITSLSNLLKQWPNILYLVIGQTHPEVRKREGETYRNKLKALVKRLKLDRNVRFVDEYLPTTELSLYMQAADIYIAPYVGRDQVSSGTITFALTHGKAIVSTPTIFADEALSHGRGLLCNFGDEYSIAKCIQRILGDRKLRRGLEANASKYGQNLAWGKVADEYANLFRFAKRLPAPVTKTSRPSETSPHRRCQTPAKNRLLHS